MRYVNTGVPNTQLNRDIFRSVLGQLSDGIWENSPACTAYWLCCDVDDGGDTVSLVVEDRPLVSYCGGEPMKNRYFDMSDADILNYFAYKIRQIIRIEKADNNCTDHSYDMTLQNQTESEYFGYEIPVRICDVCAVRNILMEVAKR